MSNQFMKFDHNAPPGQLYIWWCNETKQWNIWFGESPPQIADERFNRPDSPMFGYKLANIPYQDGYQELYNKETMCDGDSEIELYTLKSGETGD